MFLEALDQLVISVLGDAEAIPGCYCGACLEEPSMLLAVYSDRPYDSSKDLITVTSNLSFELNRVVVLDLRHLLELLRHFDVNLTHKTITRRMGNNENKP